MTPTIGLAFLAGLASFLSPCVFSLVPAYVGYLGGRSVAVQSDITDKWRTFIHGVAFVLGFSAVFITLGVTASALGGFLVSFRDILTKVGGIIVVLFGLHLIGVLRIPFLEYDLRYQSQQSERRGLLTSLLMGVFFSAGWSPCVGPVLGAIFGWLSYSISCRSGRYWLGYDHIKKIRENYALYRSCNGGIVGHCWCHAGVGIPLTVISFRLFC